MERGEELRIRVDGDAGGNRLTGRWRCLRQSTYKRMAMPEAIDLQEDG